MRSFCRSLATVAVGLVVAFASPASHPSQAQDAGRSGFVHPGLLNNQRQLNAFKTAAAAADRTERFSIAYQALKDDRRASAAYQPQPVAAVDVSAGGMPPGEASFKNDAMAAYLNALQWVATGDGAHRDKAIAILDGWAAAFQGMNIVQGPETTRQLESAWTLPMWANAAEIIRYYDNGAAGWKPESVAAFDRFIDKLYEQAALISTSRSNRGVSGALAMMSAGVYQNNRERYSNGLARLRGWLDQIVDPAGNQRELRVRDCIHPQFSLAGFVQGAEIATNQGDDSIWKAGIEDGQPRLARGLEYIATALTDGTEARDCRGKHLHAGYAAIAVAEYRRLGIAIPRFDAVVNSSKPDRGSHEFIGWSAAVHGASPR